MKGSTLIELMIVVAILGISASVASDRRGVVGSAGLAELQRERAEQVLEYQAEQLSAGRAPDPATMTRLTANLPGARLGAEREKATTRLVVSWDAPTGPRASRALVVFVPGGKR